MHRIRFPSPALVLATVALFVALSGTAVAAGIVPLAKRALKADNAAKLGGRTPAALVADAAGQPGPASTAAGLVATKTAGDSINPGSYRQLLIGCDGGKRAIGGGFTTPGAVVSMDSYPANDTTWALGLYNLGDQGASVTLHVVCLG